MRLDDAFADCQTYARARVSADAVQALEDDEDLFSELRFEADAIIGNRNQPLTCFSGGANLDGRRNTRLAEFQGIRDQIFEYLKHLCSICSYPGENVEPDFSILLLNGH